MIRRPPRSTQSRSSAASDVYKRQIEVLANSAAVNGYAAASPEHEDAMKALAGEGVVFAACSNALKGNAMTKDDIFDFITVVPAGVVELAARQAEGYAYIRP